MSLTQEDSKELLALVRVKLGISQSDFGNIIGINRRTVQRYEDRGATLLEGDWQKIARAVFPVDRALAARVARKGGASLESLGLVQPAPPPPPPAAALAKPAARGRPPAKVLVRGMIGSLCETLKMSSEDICRVLLPASQHMIELELELAEVVDVLQGRDPPPRPGEQVIAPPAKKRLSGAKAAKKLPPSS